MKNTGFILLLVFFMNTGCAQQPKQTEQTMQIKKLDMSEDITLPKPHPFKKLTPEEQAVIVNKATERPFTGKYNNFFAAGVYVCKRCGAPLYLSKDKFRSDCGWPSFDDAIPGAVKRIPDPDGIRTEIECANCGAHLGHVFMGEELTPKDTRYCVNSISLDFIPISELTRAKTDTAIFAGGCFWGVQYYMQKAPGVISTEVGYIGGMGNNPSYEKVCTHTTGYAEAVRVVFDPSKTSYEKVARMFFDIHDPTQMNRQGPDVGDQYRSAVFYRNEDQKMTAEKLIGILKNKGYHVVTQVIPATTFWKAEDYHQDYYARNNETPYCHRFVERF
jgi:peptide methionine sulfoxide reductase msrA/msrB